MRARSFARKCEDARSPASRQKLAGPDGQREKREIPSDLKGWGAPDVWREAGDLLEKPILVRKGRALTAIDTRSIHIEMDKMFGTRCGSLCCPEGSRPRRMPGDWGPSAQSGVGYAVLVKNNETSDAISLFKSSSSSSEL